MTIAQIDAMIESCASEYEKSFCTRLNAWNDRCRNRCEPIEDATGELVEFDNVDGVLTVKLRIKDIKMQVHDLDDAEQVTTELLMGFATSCLLAAKDVLALRK